MSNFVHLHLHTQFSLLDGVNKVSEVVEHAFKIGQPAIAMTDHGNMHGAIEFYEVAKKVGIKPIIGCELYLTPTSRFERKMRNQGGGGTYHLTALAKNEVGYRNLCRLVTLAYKEGFYFKPRVDHELLQSYSEGLIVLSGCMAGEFGRAAQNEDEKKCLEIVEFYSSIFKDNYYLEIQPHAVEEQQKLNTVAIELAKKKGINLVATTDCHYPTGDYHFAQEVLMCISTGKNIHSPDRMRHHGMKLHLKTAEEMLAEFGKVDYASEAIKNSVNIANQCELEFDFSKHFLPRFEVSGETLEQQMVRLANLGLKSRITAYQEQTGKKLDLNIYQARLDEELSLISKMGFAGYLLIVSDFIRWAKDQKIPVGPGRGSAASSLVAWTLQITEIDPIRHKLLLERFLNPERVSLPDIDIDFCVNGRDQVIKYVVNKYGAENVAQIATFGTLKAKAAIKDVGRAIGLSYTVTDNIAQLIPAPRQGFDFSLKDSLKMEKRLKDYAEGEGKELIELALKLEGLTRHASTHAAGVVIGDKPLIDTLPMMFDKEGNYVTQYSMKYVEKIGLVKFDFLGLKTLTVIKTATDIIKQSQGVEIDVNRLPESDSKVFDLLCAGNVTGIFQLEGGGIREVTMRLKPSCFEDIVAIQALYRPGPLDAGMVDHYIKRKHGLESVTYLHENMKSVLADTYGIIIYQEQILKLAQELAGYSLGEADILRKAMGKKVPSEMAKQRERFIKGAIEKNISASLANQIFDQMETFARYGFVRAHSVAYATISYQTAYLKAHYPVEFMAALMSFEMRDSDKTLKNLTECKKQAVNILPPDVNKSLSDFTVEAGSIRFGLSAVKSIGEKAVATMVTERQQQGGDFASFEDFVGRIDLGQVNRRMLESLIKCGAFDSFKYTRRELLSRLEVVLAQAQAINRNQGDPNQVSFFDDTSFKKITVKTSNLSEWSISQKLKFEREALGFYISGHPLEKFQKSLSYLGSVSTSKIKFQGNNRTIQVAGMITALKLRNTKKGDRYASFVLEDFEGVVEALVWPDVYIKYAQILASEDPILITARTDITEERCVLMVEKVESLIDIRDKKATQGVINIPKQENINELIEKLIVVLADHEGNCPVQAVYETPKKVVTMWLRDASNHPICVNPSEDICEEVEQIFGGPALSFR